MQPFLAVAEDAADDVPLTREDNESARGKTSLNLTVMPVALAVESLPVMALAMSSNSDRLASGGDGGGGPNAFGKGIVRLWDVKRRKEIISYPTERGVSAVAISPDGRQVAWSTWAHDVVLQTVGGEQRLRENVGQLAQLTFSPDGKLLVAATDGRKVLAWDVETGKPTTGFEGDMVTTFYWVEFSPDGKFLVTTGKLPGQPFQGTVWDVVSRRQLYRLPGNADQVFRGAISPDSQTLATCGSGGVSLWDLNTGKRRRVFDLQMQALLQAGVVLARNAAVQGAGMGMATVGAGLVGQYLGFAADGSPWASVAMPDGTVILWDAQLGKPVGQLYGHQGAVRSLALAHDGKTLITGGVDRTIRVWNLETKQQTDWLQEPQDEADLSLALAYAPDGASAAAGLADGRIRIVRLSPSGSSDCWQAHGDAAAAVAYAPDGRLLASGGYENDVKLWNPTNGDLMQTLRGHQGWNVALAFSPDGRTLASGGYDRAIILWNVADGKQRIKLSGHTAPVRALAFTHDGSLLASASADGTIRLWDTASGEQRAELTDHKGVVRGIAFSADDRLLASGGEDRVVRLWNVAAHELQSRLEKHTDVVSSLAFVDGRLVTASLDHSLTVWDIDAGKPLTDSDAGAQVIAMAAAPGGKQVLTSQSARTLTLWEGNQVESTSLATSGKYKAFVWSATFSADGTSLFVAAGGTGNSTDLYRYLLATGEKQSRVGFRGNARSVDVSPVGELLALGCATDQLLLTEAGRPMTSLETEGGHVNHVTFSADGKWLFTAALDNHVRIYNVAQRKLVSTLQGHSDWVLSLAVSPDQKELVSTSRDGTAIVWDLIARERRYTLPLQPSALESVAWSPDGKTIVTGGNFGSIKFWHAQTGIALRTLVGNRGLVYDLNFSPDGKYLVAAGEDHLTRVWDLAAGTPPRILCGHTAPVTCARFSPDGKTLVTSSTDCTVRLWDAAPPAAK
ncbi:MAG TPA: hypothetical protein VGG30_12410 [Pirellulales bacterium]